MNALHICLKHTPDSFFLRSGKHIGATCQAMSEPPGRLTHQLFTTGGSLWLHTNCLMTQKEWPRRQNGILAESFFVDDAQSECWCLLTLDLGVINKQHHSFSSTTIVHNTYLPRPPPSSMATIQNSQTPPVTSMARPNTAKTTQQCHVTTLSWQRSTCKMARTVPRDHTTNNNISCRLSFSSYVSTQRLSPSLCH